MKSRPAILPVVAVALVLLASVCNAQTPYWEQTNGPFGGNVSQIASDSSGMLFALGDNGIYRSSNNGADWTRADIGSRVTFITFAIAPNGSYFAGSANGGAFRSVDAGATWTNVSEGLSPSFLYSIAANPNGGEILSASGAGVYRTTNNGERWDTTGYVSENMVYRIPRMLVYMGDIVYAAVDSGVMRSADAQRSTWTWTDSAIAPTKIISMLTRNDTLWVASIDHGVFRSLDSGATWEARNAGLDTLAIGALDKGRTDELFVSTRDGGLYRTTDQGELWVRVNPGAHDFVASSTHHTASDRLFVASVKGLFYNDTHAIGTPWHASRNGFINSVVRTVIAGPFALYAIQYTGVFHRSLDNGNTWSITDLSLPLNSDVRAMVMDDNAAFIVSVRNVGLYSSTDQGETWSRFGTTLPTTVPEALAVGSFGKIYVTTRDGKVFASNDNGGFWTQLFAADEPTELSALLVHGDTIIATGGTLFTRSTDDGLTWTVGGARPRAYSLAMAPDKTLYAGLGLGRIARSTDFGDTWENPTSVGNTALVSSLAVNMLGHVFAGIQPGGMFVSRDRGATWRNISEGLVNPAITSVSIGASGVAYVGTYGAGVHRSIEPTTRVAFESTASRDAAFRLLLHTDANHASLELNLTRSSAVSTDIVSMTGTRIARVVSERYDAGTHSIALDLSTVAAGTYVCRMSVDGHVSGTTFTIVR